MSNTATLTSKGQLTIPNEVRKALDLVQGDVIEFVRSGPSTFTIRPLRGTLEDLIGILHRPGMKAASIEEMDEAIAQHLGEEDQRIREGR